MKFTTATIALVATLGAVATAYPHHPEHPNHPEVEAELIARDYYGQLERRSMADFDFDGFYEHALYARGHDDDGDDGDDDGDDSAPAHPAHHPHKHHGHKHHGRKHDDHKPKADGNKPDGAAKKGASGDSEHPHKPTSELIKILKNYPEEEIEKAFQNVFHTALTEDGFNIGKVFSTVAKFLPF